VRVRALVVPVTAITFLAGACRAQSPATAMDADAWRRDLRFLVEQVTTRHPNAFHRVPRGEFGREVAALDSRIPTLGADEIKVGFLHVAAQIGDGHTRLSIGVSAPHYPYQIEWLDGALRVTRAGRSAAPALGGRVVAFDDVPADTVWAPARTLVPLGETEGLVRFLGGELLAVAPVLHGLHVARPPDSVRLRVAFDDGETRRVDVNVTPPGAGVDWVNAGAPPPLSRTPAMRRPAFAWAVVPGTETGYVAWNN
jgi:hypothetical protein